MWYIWTELSSRQSLKHNIGKWIQVLFRKIFVSLFRGSPIWHCLIILIYTITFLLSTHHLELNLYFVFEFGELQRYDTLLYYQESSNRTRLFVETKILTWQILETKDRITVPFYIVQFLYVTKMYSEKGCYQHLILKVTLKCDMIFHRLSCTVMITDTCSNTWR